MKGTLVRTLTSDQVELQGLLYEAKDKNEPLIMHLHGTWGNFYENSFIDYFAESYLSADFSFLTVNLRGHDGGSISERIDQCILDLNSWIDFAEKVGYSKIILQGHSLGAIKAVYYLQHQQNNSSVSRLILLSPFDVVAFYCGFKIDSRSYNLGSIREIAKVDPNTLVPKSIWDIWLISAGTYLDLVDFDTKADMFPFRTGNLSNTPMSRLTLPVFTAFGSEDFAAYPSPQAEYNLMSQFQNVQCVVVSGAPHNFAKCETQLLKEILPWLKKPAN